MTVPVSTSTFSWPTNWKTALTPSIPLGRHGSIDGAETVTALLNFGRSLGQRIVNIAMLLLLLIGAGTVWDATVGDGALPQLTRIKQFAPEQAKLAQINSTEHLTPQAVQSSYWQALSPSRKLLLSLSPQIALWLQTLHQNGHIEIREPGDIHQTYHVADDTALLAAYRYSQDTLYLGEAFWKLSDGQKVAVITHEYRHYRQNPGKRLSYQLAQWMGMGQLQSQSPMENEAMAYEQQAATAMGLN